MPVDIWYPSLTHEATEHDKVQAFNEILDVACSDSQFAEKAKRSLAFIFTAGDVEEPPVEPPLEFAAESTNKKRLEKK